MNFTEYIRKHRSWSLKTFGSSKRAEGVLRHIEKEIVEFRESLHGYSGFTKEPLEEGIDIIILAIDLLWRMGYTPEQISLELVRKQAENRLRKWPEIGTVSDDEPTEHIRE